MLLKLWCAKPRLYNAYENKTSKNTNPQWVSQGKSPFTIHINTTWGPMEGSFSCTEDICARHHCLFSWTPALSYLMVNGCGRGQHKSLKPKLLQSQQLMLVKHRYRLKPRFSHRLPKIQFWRNRATKAARELISSHVGIRWTNVSAVVSSGTHRERGTWSRVKWKLHPSR